MKAIDVKILDENFNLVGIIDSYYSLIWTERYSDVGEFEIYTAPTDDIFHLMEVGVYASIDESPFVMVIEKSGYETSNEDGDKMLISGRSLSSLLGRRIIWDQCEIGTGQLANFQTAIRMLVNDAIISPTNPDRRIPNFFFNLSEDPRITSIELEQNEIHQYYGENLFDTIKTLCENHKVGFRVDLDAANCFQFVLFKGNDLSYDNEEGNSYVVFSDEFDNVATFEYSKNNAEYYNVALVTGEESGSSKTNSVIGTETGLNRREIHIDASNAVSKTVGGRTMSTAEYKYRLYSHGLEEMEKHRVQEECDCEVDPDSFVANQDYWIGDVVQLGMKYGILVKARVSEIIYNLDTEGYKVYPKFEMLINGEV